MGVPRKEKTRKQHQEASQLRGDMGTTVCHPVDSPVVEPPRTALVPGPIPVVPETERVGRLHGDERLSPEGLPRETL